MVKIDIVSGFLGAGKTTLIKKLLKEALNNEKVVLLENEFGDVGIDGSFMKEAGIEVTEMNSGCICCSLVGDFSMSLKKIIEDYNPQRIIIEPSGVGKLSDVIKAVEDIDSLKVNSASCVADASKCKMYSKNFGEFYNNQLESASCIILSRTADITDEKLDKAVEIIRENNSSAPIVTTPWESLDGKKLLSVIEGAQGELVCEDEECHCHDHHHEHHHDEECHCHDHHHEHHHDEECHCHDHHHEHHHDEECHCHEHHHEHHHDEECHCHDHHHEHHHADEVFQSIGMESAKKFDSDKIRSVLKELESGEAGVILRSKGILEGTDGKWFEYDYVPGEFEKREGKPDYTGRIVFIGTELNEEKIKEKLLF